MVASLHIALRRIILYLRPPKNLDAKQAVTVSYRYISWFISSICYLTGTQMNSYNYKVTVVIALFVFSRVILDYYLKSTDRVSIRFIGVVETIGLALILVPTGGLESPFIWYALNPVLATNCFEGIYCWVNLSIYLLASFLISLMLFNDEGLGAGELIQAKSNIILVYILVTIAMRLILRLVKQLDAQAEELKSRKQALESMNMELFEANLSVKRSMGYVMSLYQIIETFSLREDAHSILSQMVNSTSQIMECNVSFIWIASDKDEASSLITLGLSSYQRNSLITYLDSNAKEDLKYKTESSFEFEGDQYLMVPIKSASQFYGFMGMETSIAQRETGQNERAGGRSNELLSFLGDLVALILERHDYQELSAKLLILEEQNRIANEIHDCVSQRLFSILCGVHALSTNWNRLDSLSISRQLELIEQSTKETSKELRTSIYRLSTSNRGESLFKGNMEDYLKDFACLNNVAVRFSFDGDEMLIPSSQKEALYRIVREAAGNAVRHGKCSKLEVQLWIHEATLELMIKDNGKGFDTVLTLQDKECRGLGLNNILVLTQTYNGVFDLISGERMGTTLKFKFPLGYRSAHILKQDGGAA
ncbi:MAG: hypothetical protein H6Q63_496 [Firmicutes bacterium]|nr:hypothetical protein [Bacillota bacterium]